MTDQTTPEPPAHPDVRTRLVNGWTSARASTLCSMNRWTSRSQAAPVGPISSARDCSSCLFHRLSPAFFLPCTMCHRRTMRIPLSLTL